MKLGIHQSFDGLMDAAYYANAIGAKTCQVFIRNNRNCRSRSFDIYDFQAYNEFVQSTDFSDLVVHGVYTVNPVSSNPELYAKTVNVTKQDLYILRNLFGNKYYVIHPGSSLSIPTFDAVKRLSEFLHDIANDLVSGLGDIKICVETMAGSGSQLLCQTKQMFQLINLCKDIPQFAFTVDTCHIWGAGIGANDLLKFLKYFDKELLGVLHVNNSCNAFGSQVDRHANIRDGQIPTLDLIESVQDFHDWNPDCPIILETPNKGILQDYTLLSRFLHDA